MRRSSLLSSAALPSLAAVLLFASTGSTLSLAGTPSRLPPAFLHGVSPRNPPRCRRRDAPISRLFPALDNDGWERRRGGSVRRRPPSALFATDAGAEEFNDDVASAASSEGETSKIPAPEPPRFLAAGYTLASLANALAALLLLWNVASINTAAPTLFGPADASKQIALRYRPNLLATYTAGALGHLFLGAGTCHILSNSVKTGRLHTSGTYQRLTMGTLLFGLVGLCSLPGEAGCLPWAGDARGGITPTACGGAILAMQLAKMFVALASFAGWEYESARGEGRMKNIVREIGRGCKSVWKTMPVSDERPANFYRTFFVLLTLGNLVFNIPELVFNLQSGMGLFSLPVSLTLSSIARLGLLSSILYVLKDGAERKRLEGGTFIKLNMLVGLWAFSVGTAQGVADGPFNARKAADKLLFGVLFLNKGILSQLAKMGVIQRRDEIDPNADPPLRVIF